MTKRENRVLRKVAELPTLLDESEKELEISGKLG